MLKTILGVICGYVLWTVVWIGGWVGIGAAFPEENEAFREGGDFTAPVPLIVSIVLSVLCSALAGASSSRIGSAQPRRTAMITGVVLLLTGIGVQAASWSRMPVWYHLVFLALLLPVTVMSAKKSAAS